MADPSPPSSELRAAANSRLLVGLGLAVTLTVFILGGFSIVESRRHAWAEAERDTTNVLHVLENDIVRNVQLFDLSLQGAIEALAEPGIEDVSPGIFQHAVFDRSASADDVASILVLNSAGDLVHSLQPLDRTGVNLADREIFSVHRDHPDVGLFLGRSYRSRLRNGEFSLAFSRRISGADGRFGGVVTGALRLHYFRRLFELLDLGPNGSVILVRLDGHIVARQPFHEDDVDRDLSHSAIFVRMVGPSGRFVGTASIDGIERFYNFRRIRGLPLILSVNRSVDDILADWRRKALQTGFVLAVLCLSTLSLTMLFYREVRRRAAVEAALSAAAARLSVMATTDALTGLGNRRTLEIDLDREWRRAIRSVKPVALLMVDVDHFKLFNDRYGHPEGDRILCAIATCIQESLLRSSDRASRYGGEEFLALLPNTDEAAALAIAERMRAGVAALQIVHGASAHGHVTISIGVAVARPSIGQVENGLIKMADVALYEAKRAGRNALHLARCGAKPSSAPERSDDLWLWAGKRKSVEQAP